MFSSLKQKAIDFLEPYKQKEPAVYAAAEQAIGAVLIADGIFGTPHPFGGRKRQGIVGAVLGMAVGIVMMFILGFFGNISGISQMTATTTATVVNVGIASSSSAHSSGSCDLVASYTVDGKTYTQQSAVGSSSNCTLTAGQEIPINYNPNSPGAWAYGTKTTTNVLSIFFWFGLLFLIISIFTFIIRLFSIIFGWKLLKDGRKNAAGLPVDTNFQTMVNEIKQNFISSVFGFGAGTQPQPGQMPPQTPQI